MIRKLIDRHKKTKDPIRYWRAKGVQIGERCEIYSSVSFGSEPYLVTVGDHVRLNAGVRFITHDGGVWVLRGLYEDLEKADSFGKISVGNNVHIGTNAVIMPGVSIGNNVVIGVGAIVTKNIPDNSVAVGVPARVIETVQEYRMKNLDKFDFTKGLSPSKKEQYLLEKHKK